MKNNFIYSILCLCVLCGCGGNKTHYIGEQYLGAKYVNNPLGEGVAPDKDPLIRFDAFDCMTFVETSLTNGDVNKLNKIRYKNGIINFNYRNHFTESDWLNNNREMFENVSNLYGKTAIRHVVIDKKSWFQKNYNIYTEFEKQPINLEYIPYKNLSKINIQSPLIVLFITDGNGLIDKIGTDLAVKHVGFLLPGGTLRHASKKHGRVMDTDFMEYVSKRAKNKHNLGVVLVKIK